MKNILNLLSTIHLPTWAANLLTSVGKTITGLVSGVITMFAPIWIAIAVVTAIIILDAVYGYRVSRKYKQKKIESNKLWKTINKIKDAGIAIASAFIIDQFIITSLALHAVEFVAGLISLVEFWSMLESLCELYPKWAVWNILKKVIKAKGEKYLDINLDELSDNNNMDTKSN